MTDFHCKYHQQTPEYCDANCSGRRHPLYDSLMATLYKKYGAPIGSGRHRMTFASKRVVIKMPMNMEALHANTSEYNRYMNPRERAAGSQLARCRLIKLFGVPVIMMEKLELVDYRMLPIWAGSYDSCQVGKDRKGNFKAYDYSL